MGQRLNSQQLNVGTPERIVLGNIQIITGNSNANAQGTLITFSHPFSGTPNVLVTPNAPDSRTYQGFVRTLSSTNMNVKVTGAAAETTLIPFFYCAIGTVG